MQSVNQIFDIPTRGAAIAAGFRVSGANAFFAAFQVARTVIIEPFVSANTAAIGVFVVLNALSVNQRIAVFTLRSNRISAIGIGFALSRTIGARNAFTRRVVQLFAVFAFFQITSRFVRAQIVSDFTDIARSRRRAGFAPFHRVGTAVASMICRILTRGAVQRFASRRRRPGSRAILIPFASIAVVANDALTFTV